MRMIQCFDTHFTGKLAHMAHALALKFSSTLARITLFTCFTAAPGTTLAAEQVHLSGKVVTVACAAACGTCCGTHNLTDSTGTINLSIGNAFVDLTKIADDGLSHQFTGHIYSTTGQCGVGQCALFAVESVDTEMTAPANFESGSGKLSIQSVVIDADTDTRYRVILRPPYSVESATASGDIETATQGADCSAINTVCTSGTACLTYYGIAGPAGPQFKTCEIPCSHPGASCPLGQSCATIADGPGQVCTVD